MDLTQFMHKEDEYFFAAKSKSLLAIHDNLKTLRQKALRGTEAEPFVLILGETGVGKDTLARLIYQGSRREKNPWLVLHCALTEDELTLEKEIFGEEKFAFNQKCIFNGVLDLAKGGTVFLEKVERLPLRLQDRLLQAIESKSYRRVGGTEDLVFDVRLIAETTQNLNSDNSLLVSKNLYQTLSAQIFEISPLRERPEDILPMAHFFAECQYKNEGKQFHGFTAETLGALISYNWPGNTHELLCLIKRSALLSKDNSIAALDLTGELSVNFTKGVDQSYTQLKRHWCDSFEKTYTINTLRNHMGNVSAAAREAKLDRSNFLRMMRKHQITADEFRSRQQDPHPTTLLRAA